MGSYEKKLKDLKASLRACIVSSPKAVKLSDLATSFLATNGKPLPLKEFGHTSIFDFVRSLPDTINVFYSAELGDNVVSVVLDKNTYQSDHAKRNVKKIERLATHPAIHPSDLQARQNNQQRMQNGNGNAGQPSAPASSGYNTNNSIVVMPNDPQTNVSEVELRQYFSNYGNVHGVCMQVNQRSVLVRFTNSVMASHAAACREQFLPNGTQLTIRQVTGSSAGNTGKKQNGNKGKQYGNKNSKSGNRNMPSRTPMPVNRPTQGQGARQHPVDLASTNPRAQNYNRQQNLNSSFQANAGVLPTPSCTPEKAMAGAMSMGIGCENVAVKLFPSVDLPAVSGLAIPHVYNVSEPVVNILSFFFKSAWPRRALGFSNDEELLVVTVVVDACHFWAHCARRGDFDIWEQQQKQMNTALQQAKSLVNLPPKFSIGAALFEEDKSWYRCIVMEANVMKQNLNVFFFDYGNVEVVPMTCFQFLTSDFLQVPPQAVPGKIRGIEVNEPTNIAEFEKGRSLLGTLVNFKQLKGMVNKSARAETTDSVQTFEIEFYNLRDVSKNKGLVIDDLMRRSQYVSSTSTKVPDINFSLHDCEIITVNSGNDLCIRKKGIEPTLAQIEDKLRAYEPKGYLSNPCAMDTVLYCTPEHKQRVVVLSNASLPEAATRKVEVRSVDYGDIRYVDLASLRPLDAPLQNAPPCCMLCHLEGISLDFSKSATKRTLMSKIGKEMKMKVFRWMSASEISAELFEAGSMSGLSVEMVEKGLAVSLDAGNPTVSTKTMSTSDADTQYKLDAVAASLTTDLSGRNSPSVLCDRGWTPSTAMHPGHSQESREHPISHSSPLNDVIQKTARTENIPVNPSIALVHSPTNDAHTPAPLTGRSTPVLTSAARLETVLDPPSRPHHPKQQHIDDWTDKAAAVPSVTSSTVATTTAHGNAVSGSLGESDLCDSGIDTNSGYSDVPNSPRSPTTPIVTSDDRPTPSVKGSDDRPTISSDVQKSDSKDSMPADANNAKTSPIPSLPVVEKQPGRLEATTDSRTTTNTATNPVTYNRSRANRTVHTDGCNTEKKLSNNKSMPKANDTVASSAFKPLPQRVASQEQARKGTNVPQPATGTSSSGIKNVASPVAGTVQERLQSLAAPAQSPTNTAEIRSDSVQFGAAETAQCNSTEIRPAGVEFGTEKTTARVVESTSGHVCDQTEANKSASVPAAYTGTLSLMGFTIAMVDGRINADVLSKQIAILTKKRDELTESIEVLTRLSGLDSKSLRRHYSSVRREKLQRSIRKEELETQLIEAEMGLAHAEAERDELFLRL